MFSTSARARRWGGLLALILIAAFFRLHDLNVLPPGLHHDEAVNGLDALHVARTGELSIFFPNNNGREPLHIYLQAAAITLLGNRPWTLRLMSALAGIITIPLVYGLTRDLLRGAGIEAHRVALLAAGTLAVSYWHVNFSRIAFRAIFMIPLLTLGLWLFWRGWQKGHYRAFVASGLALGLSLYTYLPARLFPLLLAGFVLYLTLRLRRSSTAQRSSWLIAIKGSVITGLVALLVFMPLGAHFLTHPDDFSLRSQQVSIFTYSAEQGRSILQVLAGNLWATGRMFMDRGHHNPVLNFPGRPALDGVALFGFLTALAIALSHWQKPYYAFLLLWLIVMLAPTYLSNEPAHPLRAIGILPPLFILIGVGLDRLWVLTGRYRQRHKGVLWPVYLLTVLGISGWLTYRDYFQRWPQLPEVASYFSVVEAIIAERIATQSFQYDYYLPNETYEHPTTRYFLASSLRRITPSESIMPEKTVVLLYPQQRCRLQKKMALFQRTSSDSAAVRFFPANDLDVAAWLAPGSISSVILDQRGIPAARETVARPDRTQAPNLLPRVIGAKFDLSLCLLGYDLQPTTPQPGDVTRLVLYAETLKQDQLEYEAAISLEDTAGNELEQFGRQRLRLAHNGVPGRPVATAYEFTLPPETIPGKHRFEVELFRPGSSRPLPVVDRDNLPIALSIVTDYLALAVIPPDPRTIGHPLTVLVGEPPIIKLLGYDLAAATAIPNQAINLDLYWQALESMDRNYTVFIHLLNEAGDIQMQQDAEPMNSLAPTSLWLVSEIIHDQRRLTLNPILIPGEYRLYIGLYDWRTGERLPLFTATGERLVEDQLALPTPIVVVPP